MDQKKKKNFQIVVSRYNEDISWTLKYSPNVVIYNKGQDDIPNAISLPNVGRESHTYLYHIITNYHHLADLTVFVQGSCPSFGYQGKQGGHLYSNYYFDDYIHTNQEIELIVTSCISSNLNQLSLRKGYEKYRNIRRPISKMPLNTPEDHWLNFTDFSDFKKYVHNLKIDQKGNHTLESFWTTYISKKHQLPQFLYYNQGAQFSVSKEVIHRHSLSFYQALLKELDHNINPYQGYYMEWLWPYLLHSHSKLSSE